MDNVALMDNGSIVMDNTTMVLIHTILMKFAPSHQNYLEMRKQRYLIT